MTVQCMCEQPGTLCPLHDPCSTTGRPIGACPHCADKSYVPVPVPADAARDARVAARRAADARKAGFALDALMRSQGERIGTRVDAGQRFVERLGDYLESRLHHNRHYVPSDDAPMDIFQAHPEQYGRPEGLRKLHDTCIETTSHAQLAAGTRSWVCGQDCQHPYVAGDDFLCVRCGGLESDARHG